MIKATDMIERILKEKEALRTLALQIVASMTLCENEGDAESSAVEALKRLEFHVDSESGDPSLEDMHKAFARDGVTTLFGTKFKED